MSLDSILGQSYLECAFVNFVNIGKSFFQSLVRDHDGLPWFLEHFVVENAQVKVSSKSQWVSWRKMVLHLLIGPIIQLKSFLNNFCTLFIVQELCQVSKKLKSPFFCQNLPHVVGLHLRVVDLILWIFTRWQHVFINDLDESLAQVNEFRFNFLLVVLDLTRHALVLVSLNIQLNACDESQLCSSVANSVFVGCCEVIPLIR